MQTKEYHKVICWSLHEWMVILLEDKLLGICPMYHLSLDFYRAFSHKICCDSWRPNHSSV